MRCLAAASSALRPVLAEPPQPAECLGVTRGALYLRTSGPPGVLAVLCQDAVRLPCGLTLPATSAELPLTALARAATSFLVGDHTVRWTGPLGPVDVRAVREWAPGRPRGGAVTASGLAAVRAALGRYHSGPHIDEWPVTIPAAVAADHPWSAAGLGPGRDARPLAILGEMASDHHIGIAATDARPLAALGAAAGDHAASVATATAMLGRGPGLTPSGDDVLAGYLTGAVAFGLDAAALRQAIADLAPARTTALSAALIWHAARGECIDELATVAAVLTSQPRLESEQSSDRACRPASVGHSSGAGPAGSLGIAAEGALHRLAERAVSRLLSVGHSSGAALALGLVIAAESAVNPLARRAA